MTDSPIAAFAPEPMPDEYRRAAWHTYMALVVRLLRSGGLTVDGLQLIRMDLREQGNGQLPAAFLPLDLRGDHQLLLMDVVTALSQTTGLDWSYIGTDVPHAPDDLTALDDPGGPPEWPPLPAPPHPTVEWRFPEDGTP